MPPSRELFEDEVFDVVIQSVTDRIQAGYCTSGSELDLRDAVFALLEALPLLNKSLCNKAHSDARLSALLFYERCRTNSRTGFSHFLEGVPSGLPLFVGACPVEFSFQAVQDMRLIQCVANRVAHVQDLEKLDRNSHSYEQAALQHALGDLAPGLPPVVHMLISQQRSVSQALRATRPASWFAQCRNAECNRLFFVGPPSRRPNTAANSGFSSYWESLSDGASFDADPEGFCCSACHAQFARQLGAAMPPVDLDDENCQKQGPARVSESYKLALRRNRDCARHMRTVSKNAAAYSALGETFPQLKANYVKLLNCDLGILHAAQHVAESAALRHNKVLPGSTANWRSRPVFYVNAIRAVKALFCKSKVQDVILYNVALDEPFLERIEAGASKMF